jgi:hypothetical protein
VADTQVPLWITILGSIGFGSFIGGLVQQYISARRSHQEWINDNKKTEWRELIDALRESIRVMAYRYDSEMPWKVTPGADERHDEETIRKGEVVIRDRIFISKTVQESGLFQQWVELSKERDEADVSFKERPKTLPKFLEAAHNFQRELTRISRKDLGIDSKWGWRG